MFLMTSDHCRQIADIRFWSWNKNAEFWLESTELVTSPQSTSIRTISESHVVFFDSDGIIWSELKPLGTKVNTEYNKGLLESPLNDNTIWSVIFDVFTAVTMKNAVSWDVAPCWGLVRTDGLEEHFAFIFRVERMRKLGKMLAVTRRPYYC
jgi:hypothetical protein